MIPRRKFLQIAGMGGLFLGLNPTLSAAETADARKRGKRPVVLSTWNHGMPANAAAWKVLAAQGSSLDAVEAGVRVVESDPQYTSVGLGGLPDRDGRVTLDACIMDHDSRCGSVACLEHIVNPISVARQVMDKTPHVMLVGEGALRFALEQGFQKENLLTPESEKAWKEWLRTSQYKPIINIENHDTIGMLALDAQGRVAGSCTTSGLAYKMHGRVGDSPIIGAGLFVDGDVGGACATGLGETVIRVAGSHTVVELMRQGRSPQEACKEAVMRLVRKHSSVADLQVGFLALNKDGEWGGFAIHPGFNYALSYENYHEMNDAASHL